MVSGQYTGRMSRRTKEVIRIGGLLYAVLHTAYGILAALDFIPGRDGFTLTAALFLGAAWLCLAFWHYHDLSLERRHNVERLILFYLLSGIYLLTAIDLASGFAALWVLLITVTAIWFSWRGFWVGTGSFVILATVAIVTGTLSDLQLAAAIETVIVTCILAYCVVVTLRLALHDQRELDRSHAQAALQRDRTTTLMNNLADAVISTNYNGTITLYNAATLNLLDTNKSLEGKNIDNVLNLTDVDGAAVSLADALIETRAVTIRDDLQTKISGELTRIEATYAPIRRTYSGKVKEGSGYIIILRDVTKTKSLEEERDEFISVVSHELRTPITIAEGTVSNAQLMLSRDDIAPQKIAAAVDMAHEQIVFLAKMVNDLSTLSRAERGVSDEPELIDINQLAGALYTEYQSEASAKGLAFNLKVPAGVGSVYASQLYLKELLQNFITNAIKYTNDGSITLEVIPLKQRRVMFAVHDTGVGISKADQKSIFEKFYRAEDYRTRETNGTGLGLYVATKLARKLATTINIKSRLNHGSTFSIIMPLSERAPKDRPAA